MELSTFSSQIRPHDDPQYPLGLVENQAQADMTIAVCHNETLRLAGKQTEIVKQMPDLRDLERPTFLGSLAWTEKGGNKRWVLEQHAHIVPYTICTSADFTRAYLNVKFPKWKGRVIDAQYHAVIHTHRSPPLYARHGWYEDCVYLDLKAAYWSIVRRLGWDVDYLPGRFIRFGQDMSDYPFHWNKVARSCLVTGVLPSMVTLWDGAKLVSLTLKKPHLNVMLWAAVMDVLNGIADDMVTKAGAVYVHTDGYIIPRAGLPAAQDIEGAWGFRFGDRYTGFARIYNVGRYDMPGHECKNRSGVDADFSSIRMVNPDWLRVRVGALSR